MDIIKNPLALLATFLLIACGSESDKSSPAEIIFPEHLPKVNPNLSQEDQSGIWMVYRATTENSQFTNGDGEIVNIEKEIIANELGTIILDTEHDYYQHSLNCTPYEFSSDDGLYIRDTHENGHLKLYRDNIDEEFGSSGRISVSYLSSQKIHGRGWKTQHYLVDGIKTGFHQQIEFFAVKVSDENNFLLSDDLDYSSSVNSENISFDENEIYGGMCLGLQEHKYSAKIDNVKVDSYTFENLVHFADYDHTFEIYNGKSNNTTSENTQVIGVQRRGFHKSIDHHCVESETECLNSLSLDTEILQNDSSGISFTAKLTGNEDLNNEVYIDAQVSVIIHPFEPALETQE